MGTPVSLSVLPVRNAAPEEAAGKGSPFQSCQSSSSLLFVFLQDDSPPVYPTSPGPVPITLAMDHVVVRRRDDGVFYLTGQQHPGFIVPLHPWAVLEETGTET